MKKSRKVSWLSLVIALILVGIALLGLRDGDFALPITRAGVMISGWIARILNVALLLFGLLFIYSFICSLRKVDEHEPGDSR